MTDSAGKRPQEDRTDFEKAGDAEQDSLVGEFWQFITENKKWWLIPILLVMLLMGALMVLGSTGAAPFIYTLF